MKRWRLKWKDPSKEKPENGMPVIFLQRGMYESTTYYNYHFEDIEYLQAWAYLPDLKTQAEYLECGN